MSVLVNGGLRNSVMALLAGLLTAGSFSLGQAADRPPDDLFVAAKSILQGPLPRKPLILVDIRPKDDFWRLRIPGSLNIPLAFIKNKVFLQKATLVLVGWRYGRRLLEAECRRLKARGFKAAILRGGLSAWKQAGGRLQGNLTALGQADLSIPRPYLTQRYPTGRAGRGGQASAGSCRPCRRLSPTVNGLWPLGRD